MTNPTPSSRPVAGAEIGSIVEAAFSEPDAPLTAQDVRHFCTVERDSLINNEVQFSDPAWTFLHQMEQHATRLDALDALREAVKPVQEDYDEAMRGCEWAPRTVEIGRPELHTLLAALSALLGGNDA